MKKEDIRYYIRARKSLLDDNGRRSAAASVFKRLENTAAFIMARNILMYHSLPDELSTHDFLDKWSQKKNFYLPRVNGVNLDILPYDRSTLRLGAFHIEEPDGADTVDIEKIDLIVVPAVAYDRNGNRVGRGRGYYDRLLTSSRAVRVGVGYDFQLIDDDIEAETHDQPMNIVITENRMIIVR